MKRDGILGVRSCRRPVAAVDKGWATDRKTGRHIGADAAPMLTRNGIRPAGGVVRAIPCAGSLRAAARAEGGSVAAHAGIAVAARNVETLNRAGTKLAAAAARAAGTMDVAAPAREIGP